MSSTPKRGKRPTKAMLQSRIADLESQNQVLRYQLSAALAALAKSKKPTPSQLRRMNDAGISYPKIAEQMGLTRESVRWACRSDRGYRRPRKSGARTSGAMSKEPSE